MSERNGTVDAPSAKRKRKRIEECFGGLKKIALVRKVRQVEIRSNTIYTDLCK